MPLYEFACEACRHRFTLLLAYKDREQAKCPRCGSKQVRPLLGSFSVAGRPPATCSPASPQGGG